MSSKEQVLKLLGVKKEEESTVSLMLAYSFFFGIAAAIFYTASTSLFLSTFERNSLPYAYMIGGLLVYVLGLLFAKIQKKIKYSQLLIYSILFLIITTGVLLTAYAANPVKWLNFIIFLWLRVVLFIQLITFWGLATAVFDLRQSKRLFGLLGTGEVVSYIISYFSIPYLLKIMTTEDLLSVALGSIVVSLFVMLVVVKKFGSRLSVRKKGKLPDEQETEKIAKVRKPNLYKNKYFKYVFLMAILPVFAIFYIDFIFFAQTKTEYPDKELLSSFLGIFLGVVSVAELFIKTFLSGKLINKYGLKLGLVILPILLLASVLLASVSGTIFGTATLFFYFVALNKLFIRAVRSSTYDPSFQILYQPVESHERLLFQSKIEGGPKAIGNIIAGGTLLLLTHISFLNLVHFNYIFLLILAYWVKVSFSMYNEYRNKLKANLAEFKSQANLLTNDTTDLDSLFIHQLQNVSPGQLSNLFRLLCEIDRIKACDALMKVLPTGTNEFKISCLREVEKNSLVAAIDIITKMKVNGESEEIWPELTRTLDALKSYEAFPFEKAAALIDAPDADERIFAANYFSSSGRYNSYKYVAQLLRNRDEAIVRQAISAAGKIKRIELWDALIKNLAFPEYYRTCASAIQNIGPQIIPELESEYRRMNTSQEVKLRIIKLFGSLKGKAAVESLRRKLHSSEPEITYEVIAALSRHQYKADKTETSLIYDLINSEISFMLWVMAAIMDIGESQAMAELAKALVTELKDKKEKIFLFLSLLYEPKTIMHVRQNLESEDLQARAYALEIIDMIVSESIKDNLLLLLDEAPYEETIEKFKFIYPQERLEPAKRINDILNKDFSRINRWTKVCAIRALTEYPSENPVRIISAFLNHPDQLIMEASLNGLYYHCSREGEKGLERFYEICARLKIKNTNISSGNFKGGISIFDKVKALKGYPVFASISEYKLADLAIASHEAAVTSPDTGTTNGRQLKPEINYNILYNLMAGDMEILQNILSFLAAQNNYELREYA